MPNNDTFGQEDEWYCLHGPKMKPEEAAVLTKLQCKIIKNRINELKELRDKEEKGSIIRKQANFNYVGLLWKYEEMIKLIKAN